MTGEAWCQSTPEPATFEVASVKLSPPDAQGMFVRPLPGGLRISGATLRNLISIAYSVRGFQISGGPKWLDTERFDIEARAAAAPAGPPAPREEQKKINERLRNLLADRFQLTLHPETREQPVYSLVVAKGGPKLQESAEPGSLIRMLGRGKLNGRAVGLGMLALNLSNELGRTVIDRTGLTAKYSFQLNWVPSTNSPDAPDPDGPSVFAALQEQLGLRLEAGKGPVEVLIIDRVEMPSGN